MRTLLYSALDLAVIISNMELGCQDESRVIDLIWEGEKAFFDAKYRTDKRKFILDVRYWMHYIHEKPVLDKEISAIQKDLKHGNHDVNAEQYTSDYSDLDLFFKGTRIRILYGNGKPYVRIKMRSLLTQYGYKRYSQRFIQHINRCMFFYHLEVTLRGGVPCNIKKADLDKMLIFRVV